MRILESHGVDFATFQLEGRTRRWWEFYLLGKPADSPPITWDRYIPPSQREELRFQFEQLQQGHVTVTDYEVRFSDFSCHALMILPTEAKRVRRFVAGLHIGIQVTMAREVKMCTSYDLVVEIAQSIEGVRQHSREQVMRDKRFRYSGEFRGAPSGGRGQFIRGQSSKPPSPAPLPPWGIPVRPYFSVIPESSYRPPAIQGSSSGYSGPHGQTLSQQPIALKRFYKCGDPSHIRRFCPRLWGRLVQQGQQPMITALVAPPVVRPLRGGGQMGRGHPRDGGQPVGAPARFYAFAARPDAEASDAVITNTPTIDSVPVVQEFSDVFPSDLPGSLEGFTDERDHEIQEEGQVEPKVYRPI
ncbi:uncharacterized protein [Nicotiana tomentosiformis]|uniref:uncharacterized protein n=1 Tax=Nicotiana tomentosiformis TaxID=4098 RepID=UPI00388CA47E